MDQCIDLGTVLAGAGAVILGLATIAALLIGIWFLKTKRLAVVDKPEQLVAEAPATPAEPKPKKETSPLWWVASTLMFSGIAGLAAYIFLSVG